MNGRQVIIGALVAFVVVFGAQYSAVWMANNKPNIVSKFNLQNDRIVKDLDGHTVNLMLNQVWPFESSQNINVQVVSKRQVDEFVVVIADIKALVAVQQPPDVPKEQFSTNTNSKDVPKSSPHLPSKLQLTGKMKLTYELIDNEWYLVGTDNLNLKAVPLD